MKCNMLGTCAGCIGYGLACHERIEAMRTARLLGLIGICVCILTLSGCGGQLTDLQVQNDIQQKRIGELTSTLDSEALE